MKAEEQTPITPDKNLIYAKIGGCLINQESNYVVMVVSDLMEQYAELRIQQELQQEREKWKEEVIEALEMKDVKIYTGLRDLNGDRIYRGDVVRNEVGERGVIMYWDGAFCVAYFDEPAKEYLHTLAITDKNYCSTGKLKLTKITKPKSNQE